MRKMQYNHTRKTPGKHLKLTRKPCIYYEKYTRNIPEISGITCKLQVFPPETGVSVKYCMCLPSAGDGKHDHIAVFPISGCVPQSPPLLHLPNTRNVTCSFVFSGFFPFLFGCALN